MNNHEVRKNELSESIRVVRPILILLVCIVHMPYINGYLGASIDFGSPQSLLSVYFKDVLARASVPLLSVISGYFAYTSYNNYGYSNFIYKKVKTILIPFILASTLPLAIALIISYFFNVKLLSIDFGSINEFMKSAFGINRLPVNAPLYFIRDLFLICLLIPIIKLSARSGFTVLIVSLALIYYNFKIIGAHISFEGFYLGIMYRLDTIIFFLLGYYFAKSNFKLELLKGYNIFLLMMIYGLIILVTSLFLILSQPKIEYYIRFRWAVGLLSVSFIPVFISCILALKNNLFYMLMYKLSPYSFMIFLTHLPFNYIFIRIFNYLNIQIDQNSIFLHQILFSILYLTSCAIFAIIIKESMSYIKIKTGLEIKKLSRNAG